MGFSACVVPSTSIKVEESSHKDFARVSTTGGGNTGGFTQMTSIELSEEGRMTSIELSEEGGLADGTGGWLRSNWLL